MQTYERSALTLSRLLIFVGLSLGVFASASAYLGWAHLTKVGKSSVYYQLDGDQTLREPRIYILYDYGEPGEYKDLSSVYHYEANCKTGHLRRLSFEYFDGEMGQGSAVRKSTSKGEWECPKKATVAHMYWQAACASTLEA
jgi:hypothetical protein